MSFESKDLLLLSYLQFALSDFGSDDSGYHLLDKVAFDYYGHADKFENLVLKVTPYNKKKIEEYCCSEKSKKRYELTKEDFMGLEPAEKDDDWTYDMMVIVCKQNPTLDDVSRVIGIIRRMASTFNLDKTRIPIKVTGAEMHIAVIKCIESFAKDGFRITIWQPSSKKLD